MSFTVIRPMTILLHGWLHDFRRPCRTGDGMFDNYMPAYFISDEMMELFQRGDLRTNLFIGASENFRQSPVFLKVNGQQRAWGNYSEVSDCFLLRTPEAYLTLAEASACAGDEAEARRVLETFLETRMETAPSITQTGSELVGLIRDERAREFLLEAIAGLTCGVTPCANLPVEQDHRARACVL